MSRLSKKGVNMSTEKNDRTASGSLEATKLGVGNILAMLIMMDANSGGEVYSAGTEARENDPLLDDPFF
ncbi:MAG: hypothetical protein WC349_00330 [Patescibacteria group bacterium]